MNDDECLINAFEEQIMDYVASVGVRAENTQANKQVYVALVQITYMVCKYNKDNNIYIDYLHFIDCVASNILGVPIYYGTYKSEPRTDKLKGIYYRLKVMHDEIDKECNQKLKSTRESMIDYIKSIW